MGGSSPEREVSLNSGEAVYQALDQSGHRVDKLVFENDLQRHIDRLKDCDLVFNALHGGQGENGVIQGFLESIGVPYTGSGVLSSALCMDKHLSKLLIRNAGHLTADWKIIETGGDYAIPVWTEFPMVVKPNDLGSTIGLKIVQAEVELKPAVDEAARLADLVMLEKYIAGRELTVTVLGDQVLPVVEIVPSHGIYDYECKYTAGLSNYEYPAKIEPETAKKLQADAAQIFRVLQCQHYCRIDYRFDADGEFWFLEANTLPGMTSTSLVPKAAQAAGLSFPELIERIIQLAVNG